MYALLIFLLLLSTNATAGITFAMTSTPVEVRENQMRTGDNLYAQLRICIAVIVNNHTFIHVYPSLMITTKEDVLAWLLDGIHKDDRVYIVPSSTLFLERDIKLKDILDYLKKKGVKDIQIYDKPKLVPTEIRYVQLYHGNIIVKDESEVGSSFYSGSEPCY